MDTIAFFIGGLLAVALITTIFSWLLRSITVPISRVLISNALSLFVTTTLGGFGLANGSDPEFGKAFSLYVLPQLTFLVFSLWKFNRNNQKKQQSHQQPDFREPLRHTPSMNLPIQPRMAPPAQRPINQRTLYAQKPQSSNFIVRYWRGQFSLGVSYWMFGFLGGLLVATIPYIAFAIFSPNSGYEPIAIFAALIFTWVLVLAITLWQIVGVWRSADNHMQSRIRLGLASPWAALAKMAVIIGALNLAVQLFGVVIPQLMETTRMAFMNDPDIPNYSIRVMRNGTEAEVTGGFKYGLTNDFVKILSASPQVHVLHLNSLGGRVGEAEKLYEVIRANRIITYVSANCMSACTVAFAGGVERWLRDGAKLGFHAPNFPGMSETELQGFTESQRKIFATAGFSSSFIDRALATPNADMWTPPNSELFSSRVVTALSDGTQFAASGYGGSIPKEEMALSLSEYLPALLSLKVRFPKEYGDIINSFFDSYVAGHTETEVITAARTKLLPLVIANRGLADDTVLIDFGKLLVDQYSELGAKNPEYCYLYASGFEGNFAAEFSPELIKRENELVNQIFLTTAPRAPISEEVSGPLWEKVMARLTDQVGSENLGMFQETKVDPVKYAEYCKMVTVLYQEIIKLNAVEAAILMRQSLAAP